MTRSALLLLLLLATAGSALAQGDLAYMPAKAPANTADDERISMSDTEDPGVVRISFPSGTYRVDLINAHGEVVEQMAPEEAERFDVTGLRSGTWTMRARTPQGYSVRRFAVRQHHGMNQVADAAPMRKKR